MNMIKPINPWRIFALVSIAVFLVSLDATIGFAVFPALRMAFPLDTASGLSWVLTAYTIVYAALLVPAGRLADLLGRKRLFMVGVGVFTLASGLCGVAPNLETLIAFRVLQAIGAALLTPTSLALILQAFPEGKRAVAVSLWGAVGALAAAIGPSVGALIIENTSWHWAFLVNVPVGIVALLRARVSLQESSNPHTGRSFDAPGILLLIAGSALLTLGIVQSDAWGWAEPKTGASIIAGLLILLAFIFWAKDRPHAAVDLSLFQDRNYSIVNVATLIFGAAFTAMFLCFFLFTTLIWGYGLAKAGLSITPGPLLVIPVAVISGRYAARHGHRNLLIAGGLVYALSGLWFYFAAAATADYLSAWLPGLLISGVGVGMVLPSLSGAAVSNLAASRFGVGSAVNAAVRQFGSALGVAFTVAIVGGNLHGIAQFKYVFLFIAAGGLLTSLLALPLSRRSKKIVPAAPGEAVESTAV
ncbi:DHA2 family efflux MFS transporter permease subunit [Undibacterium sp. TJN19]|uniref:DHA2 family efflux MFS transporter permease subunit n=1 Tax=Undibacterium sp. TJN19 TaxID=3413055 RepID=UPI003BEFB38F